jgi:hypothetical protein
MKRTSHLRKTVTAAVVAATALVGGSIAYRAIAAEGAKVMSKTDPRYEVHDMKRPRPVVITPGTESTQAEAGKAPSDALVLFDGKDLSHWEAEGGKGEAPFKIKGGYMEAAKPGMQTKDKFGDIQLHAEWSEPEDIKGESQGRGNSGFYIMGRYEVQVLDSYKNDTYADGQAAALYGQYPPLVNSTRPPGQWNVYDIVFHRPRFDESGKVTKPATVTVFHNGVLVQDHAELKGATGHHQAGTYEKHADREPLHIQFHGNPVRFRNIWVRDLEKSEKPS